MTSTKPVTPHMTQRRAWALVGCALAATALACGRSDSGAAATVSTGGAAAAAERVPDPCTLLTTDEVRQQLGWTVSATSDTTTMPGRGSCEYAATAGNRKLWLFLGPSSSEPTPNHYRVNAESYARDMGYKNIELIDDIGSAAMWVPEVRHLTVVVPGYELQVIDMSAGEDASLNLEQARALAQKVIGRLN